MMRKIFLAAAVLLIAAAPDDEPKRVADALAAGSSARTPAQRAAAARILDGLGAHPEAGGDDLALAWRGKGHSIVTRERLLGPAYRRIMIESRGTARFEQAFLAGRLARVAVAPVRNAPFRLQVSGDQGQSYCPDGARSCEWVPAAVITNAVTSRSDVSLHDDEEFGRRLPAIVDLDLEALGVGRHPALKLVIEAATRSMATGGFSANGAG